MQETGAEGVGAGEEGHADGFVVGDALEGADEVGAFEVLLRVSTGFGGEFFEFYGVYELLTRGSTGL